MACCLEEEAVVALGFESPGFGGWRCLGVLDLVFRIWRMGGECVGVLVAMARTWRMVSGEWSGLSISVSLVRARWWWVVRGLL
jgi:hypothetical protein